MNGKELDLSLGNVFMVAAAGWALYSPQWVESSVENAGLFVPEDLSNESLPQWIFSKVTHDVDVDIPFH